jgi:hypothetical protein
MAIKVEVHANLAAAAKRQKEEIVGARNKAAVGCSHRQAIKDGG